MTKYTLIAAVLGLMTATAQASDQGRNIAGKLTNTPKPAVRVLTEDERAAVEANQVAFDLSVDPEQVICRKERVSSESRLMTRRCKTIAEFRVADQLDENRFQKLRDDTLRRQSTITRGNTLRRTRLPITGQ